MSGRFPVINCRHFPSTFLLVIAVFLLQPLPITARSRWRRQALPYDNLQVHSMDSNVTIAGDVHVVSMESRIDFREAHFNASVWSSSSSLHFDPSSDSFTLTATGTALESRLNDALVQSVAAALQLNASTHRGGDGESELRATLDNGNVNISVADSSGLRIEAANGRAAHLLAESRQTNSQRKINASVANSEDGQRQLRITFESGTYFAQVEILQADVGIFYGQVRIQISADYRRVVLLSGLYRIEILTATSPFSIIVTDQELNITSPNEQLDVRLRPNSTDVLIDAGMTSRLAMNRSADSVVNVRGSSGSALPVDRLEMLSRQLALQLSAAGAQNISVLATALQSNISMQMASTKMNMLATRHLVEVFGGRPQVFLGTGNISVIINVLSSVDETSVTLMPPFTTPSSAFGNIDPFGDRASMPPRMPSWPSSGSVDLPPVTRSPWSVSQTVGGNEVTLSELPGPASMPSIVVVTPQPTLQEPDLAATVGPNNSTIAPDFPDPAKMFPGLDTNIDVSPRSVSSVSSSTTPDPNFVIGQYQFTTLATDLSTIPDDAFPYEATISKITGVDGRVTTTPLSLMMRQRRSDERDNEGSSVGLSHYDSLRSNVSSNHLTSLIVFTVVVCGTAIGLILVKPWLTKRFQAHDRVRDIHIPSPSDSQVVSGLSFQRYTANI